MGTSQDKEEEENDLADCRILQQQEQEQVQQGEQQQIGERQEQPYVNDSKKPLYNNESTDLMEVPSVLMDDSATLLHSQQLPAQGDPRAQPPTASTFGTNNSLSTPPRQNHHHPLSSLYPQQQQREQQPTTIALTALDTNNDLARPLLPQQQEQEQIQQEQANEETASSWSIISTSSGNFQHHPALEGLRETVEQFLIQYTGLGLPAWKRRIRQWIRRAGNYLGYCTLTIMLIVVPIVIYNSMKTKQLDVAAYKSAGIMVCGTIVLSCRLVYLHLTHWYMPDVQKYVVRIVWMVPLYATQSYLSLCFRRGRVYIDTIRDFYEAFVIASFVYYLIELLGGQDSLVHILHQKPERLGHHSFPLNFVLQPWQLGHEFMLQCKHGVLQYVVFKTFSTLLTLLLVYSKVYGEGKFHWGVAYPYMCFFENVSVMYALYCLVMLYSAVNEELQSPINWRPLGKFLCVKGVIFFTWWQGILIFYFRAHGWIEALGSWNSEEVAYGLIDYCVVFEMVCFAVVHGYTFTYKEYLPSNLPTLLVPTTSTPAHSTNPTNSSSAVAAKPDAMRYDQENCVTATTDEECDHSAVTSPLLLKNGNESITTPTTYRPPATLSHPMNFKDAFWSSTVPKETIHDIQVLQRTTANELMERYKTSYHHHHNKNKNNNNEQTDNNNNSNDNEQTDKNNKNSNNVDDDGSNSNRPSLSSRMAALSNLLTKSSSPSSRSLGSIISLPNLRKQNHETRQASHDTSDDNDNHDDHNTGQASHNTSDDNDKHDGQRQQQEDIENSNTLNDPDQQNYKDNQEVGKEIQNGLQQDEREKK